MTDPYQVILHDAFATRLRALRQRAAADPQGLDSRVFRAAIEAAKVLAAGREASFRGERLGYSPKHSDLRDCAEIKVAVVREYTNVGKPRGPSHRMIYREYHGTADDPRPIRQIVAFEHRAGGLPFTVAAAALGRAKGRAVEALTHLPAAEPGIGSHKDRRREITPPRLPLPPDLAAALGTSSRRPPGRPTAVRPTPVRRAARSPSVVQRDHR